MARSVNYLNNAETVIYFTADFLTDDTDEHLASFHWLDFQDNLIYEIQLKLKSYIESNKRDNRETNIILENNLCCIGISEYCGLYSLSVAPNYNDYESLGKHHAQQITKTLEKCLEKCGVKLLNRIGAFSNGSGVFEYKS